MGWGRDCTFSKFTFLLHFLKKLNPWRIHDTDWCEQALKPSLNWEVGFLSGTTLSFTQGSVQLSVVKTQCQKPFRMEGGIIPATGQNCHLLNYFWREIPFSWRNLSISTAKMIFPGENNIFLSLTMPAVHLEAEKLLDSFTRIKKEMQRTVVCFCL